MCGLNDIKLFLDNWENENSISLEICYSYNFEERLEDLLKDYKANGVIKKYCYSLSNLNIMTNPFTYE
ncbi:hypothetical protein GLOIN_2v1622563 [Rhizophagus clarus]|nr:hypothetical protein GLOIN_2v1622563 [Rhizophagus clarus]